MYINCEEKINGTVPEGTSCFCKGKVAWLDLEMAKKEHEHLSSYFKEKPTPERLAELKDKFKICLKMKSFVFFDTCYYRYRVSTSGNLKHFGLNFFKID